MRVNTKFKPGDLARVKLYLKEVSPEGFTTITFHPGADCGVLYEYINIATYPSSRDFLGRQVSVRENQEVVILDYVGRPWSFLETRNWELYDVYEVLADGYICHIFSYNLEKIENE